MVTLYADLEIYTSLYPILWWASVDSEALVYRSTTWIRLGISGCHEFVRTIWHNSRLLLLWSCGNMRDSLYGILCNWLEMDELLHSFCLGFPILLNDSPEISLFNRYDLRHDHCLLAIRYGREILLHRRLVDIRHSSLQENPTKLHWREHQFHHT